METSALPSISGTAAGAVPDLDAIDYRADPSAGQARRAASAAASRDDPNSAGSAVPPVPDRTIQVYDLPDQLAGYDRTRPPAGE